MPITIHEDGIPPAQGAVAPGRVPESLVAPEAGAEAEAEAESLPIRKVGPGLDEVTDEKGRRILVRTIGPRERMRLFKAIGPTNSKNEPYVGTATLAFAVSKIDDDPVPVPANEIGIEALVDRLGDEGIGAVAKVMMVRMGITEKDLDEANGDPVLAAQIAGERKRKETMAAAKNSRTSQS